MPDQKRLEKLNKILDWKENKPKKDADWAEDVKHESLHVKFDYQLAEMETAHEKKLTRSQKDLDKITNWPDVVRYELTQRFTGMFEREGNPETLEGKTLQEWVDDEFASQELHYQWKVEKIEQSMERIKKERGLRKKGFLEVLEVPKNDKRRKADDPEALAIRAKGSKMRVPIGTTYYIDPVNGNNANDGLGTGAGNAWLDLDQFTENARSAGDKVIIRRGANQCDNGTDLNFTSDGTIANPIIIEADFDNAWSDNANSAQTYTMVFGSKTHTASATITGISAGDWIYVTGDNQREFAYEVASVSGTTLTLYLPFKGTTGAGLTLVVMQDNPIWNTAAGDFQWNFDTDNYWKVQGVHIRGTDANGNVEIDSSLGHNFVDCIFQGNGTTDAGIEYTDDASVVVVKKCRFFGHVNNIDTGGSDVWGYLSLDSCLLDGNSVANSYGIEEYAITTGMRNVSVSETEFKGHTTATFGDIAIQGVGSYSRLRNSIFGTIPIGSIVSGMLFGEIGLEDYDGTVGDTRFHKIGPSSSNTAALTQSETTTVRSGGSNKSIKVTPTTNLNTIWDFNKLLVFEIPIYATTASKTYTVYFRPSATTDWTNDPTASELWIELEAWGHASNNFRKITKSTGVIDMNGSTAWQALTVTVAPAQAGVAYLRCWYAKTKEAGSNVFFCDPIPVIS